MTAQQPEHCEHECVCHWHVEGKVKMGNNGLCRKPDCHFDTRTRPHTPAPECKYKTALEACNGAVDDVARAATLAAYIELGFPCFGKYKPLSLSCITCAVWSKCYDKMESLRQAGEPE
jgi:hypothetical protein